MDEIPKEWIDKIFNCMNLWFGERWEKQIGKIPEDLIKNVWQSGLQGLTYEQIKRALVLLKRQSENSWAIPPHIMEFFRFAKGSASPHIDYDQAIRYGDPEVASKALAEIKGKLRNYAPLK